MLIESEIEDVLMRLAHVEAVLRKLSQQFNTHSHAALNGAPNVAADTDFTINELL